MFSTYVTVRTSLCSHQVLLTSVIFTLTNHFCYCPARPSKVLRVPLDPAPALGAFLIFLTRPEPRPVRDCFLRAPTLFYYSGDDIVVVVVIEPHPGAPTVPTRRLRLVSKKFSLHNPLLRKLLQPATVAKKNDFSDWQISENKSLLNQGIFL